MKIFGLIRPVGETINNRSFALRIAILLLAAAVSGSVFYLWWTAGEYATLERLSGAGNQLAAAAADRPLVILSALFLFYFLASCCSIPGTVLSSALAGSILGLWPGLALASVALTLGSSAALLIARYLIGDWVRRRVGNRFAQSEIAREGRWVLYVLSLRLNPAIPYFLVNWGMAVTPIKVTRFALASQIGMLPVLFIYVNAGAQLSKVRELSGLMSFDVVAALLLLSCLPLILRAAR